MNKYTGPFIAAAGAALLLCMSIPLIVVCLKKSKDNNCNSTSENKPPKMSGRFFPRELGSSQSFFNSGSAISSDAETEVNSEDLHRQGGEISLSTGNTDNLAPKSPGPWEDQPRTIQLTFSGDSKIYERYHGRNYLEFKTTKDDLQKTLKLAEQFDFKLTADVNNSEQRGLFERFILGIWNGIINENLRLKEGFYKGIGVNQPRKDDVLKIPLNTLYWLFNCLFPFQQQQEEGKRDQEIYKELLDAGFRTYDDNMDKNSDADSALSNIKYHHAGYPFTTFIDTFIKLREDRFGQNESDRNLLGEQNVNLRYKFAIIILYCCAHYDELKANGALETFRYIFNGHGGHCSARGSQILDTVWNLLGLDRETLNGVDYIRNEFKKSVLQNMKQQYVGSPESSMINMIIDGVFAMSLGLKEFNADACYLQRNSINNNDFVRSGFSGARKLPKKFAKELTVEKIKQFLKRNGDDQRYKEFSNSDQVLNTELTAQEVFAESQLSVHNRNCLLNLLDVLENVGKSDKLSNQLLDKLKVIKPKREAYLDKFQNYRLKIIDWLKNPDQSYKLKDIMEYISSLNKAYRIAIINIPITKDEYCQINSKAAELFQKKDSLINLIDDIYKNYNNEIEKAEQEKSTCLGDEQRIEKLDQCIKDVQLKEEAINNLKTWLNGGGNNLSIKKIVLGLGVVREALEKNTILDKELNIHRVLKSFFGEQDNQILQQCREQAILTGVMKQAFFEGKNAMFEYIAD